MSWVRHCSAPSAVACAMLPGRACRRAAVQQAVRAARAGDLAVPEMFRPSAVCAFRRRAAGGCVGPGPLQRGRRPHRLPPASGRGAVPAQHVRPLASRCPPGWLASPLPAKRLPPPRGSAISASASCWRCTAPRIGCPPTEAHTLHCALPTMPAYQACTDVTGPTPQGRHPPRPQTGQPAAGAAGRHNRHQDRRLWVSPGPAGRLAGPVEMGGLEA